MMKVRIHSAALLAGLLIGGAAVGQTTAKPQDPHHTASTEDPAAPEAATPEGPAISDSAALAADGAGSGMMMSPQMMQMMMQMMAQHHPDGSMPMPQGAMGSDSGMAGMPQGAGAAEPGPEVILGLPGGPAQEMTPDLVRTWLQDRLDRLGNPRLALGAISTAEDGSITAEIRTVDGALVQKLAFNRFPGFVRQID